MKNLCEASQTRRNEGLLYHCTVGHGFRHSGRARDANARLALGRLEAGRFRPSWPRQVNKHTRKKLTGVSRGEKRVAAAESATQAE